jgi:hypothetical protein
MTGGIVSTATYGDLKLVPLGESKRDRNIISVHTTHNQCRAAVDQSIETAACPVILSVRRAGHATGQ